VSGWLPRQSLAVEDGVELFHLWDLYNKDKFFIGYLYISAGPMVLLLLLANHEGEVEMGILVKGGSGGGKGWCFCCGALALHLAVTREILLPASRKEEDAFYLSGDPPPQRSLPLGCATVQGCEKVKLSLASHG
jgi:hypothetical protein